MAKQRKWHRAGTLRGDRKHALDQLGFDWHPIHAAKKATSLRAFHVRQNASPWALGVSGAPSSAEDGGSGRTQASVTWIGPDDLPSSRDGDEAEGSRLDVLATGAASPGPVVGGWGKSSSAYEEKQQFVFSHIHGWWKGDGGGGDESSWRDTRRRVRAMRLGLMDGARHVIGCRLTQEPRVQNACDDVVSIIHESLSCGTTTLCRRRRDASSPTS